MKKTALAIAVLAMTPFAAQADLLFTVGAKASVWNTESKGDLDEGVSVEDDGLNLDKENGTQISVFFEHPVPFLPNIKVRNTSLEIEGDGSLVAASFADQTFNENVPSRMDLTHNDLTLYWGLPLPVPFLDINFGLNARQFDGDAEVSGEISGRTETVDLDFVLPMVYGEVKINTPIGIYGNVDINYVGYGDNKMSDISYGLGYDLPIPVVDLGIEAGYRSLNLQTDPDDVDIDADVDVSGTYFGASLSVGF